jgi:hypothetical protein
MPDTKQVRALLFALLASAVGHCGAAQSPPSVDSDKASPKSSQSNGKEIKPKGENLSKDGLAGRERAESKGAASDRAPVAGSDGATNKYAGTGARGGAAASGAHATGGRAHAAGGGAVAGRSAGSGAHAAGGGASASIGAIAGRSLAGGAHGSHSKATARSKTASHAAAGAAKK